MKREILKADVIYNGLGLPRANAGVLVQDDGRSPTQILNIDSLDVLLALAKELEMDFPVRDMGFALSPAPVNASIDVDAYLINKTVDMLIEDLAKTGLGAVGLLTSDEAVVETLLLQDMSGVVYWQLRPDNSMTCVEQANLDDIVTRLRKFRQIKTDSLTGTLNVGLAIKYPHLLEAELLRNLGGLAKQNALPLQLELSKESNVSFLEKSALLVAEPSLLVTSLQSEDDIRTMKHNGCTAIYCPSYYVTSDYLSSVENENLEASSPLDLDFFQWDYYMKHSLELAFATGQQVDDFDICKLVSQTLEHYEEQMNALAAVRSAVKGGYRALKMKTPQVRKTENAEQLYAWSQSA